jgi:putative sterol carrier protein
MPDKHVFLSEGWIAAARDVYDRHRGEAPPVPVVMRANLNITEVPFGESPLQAHLDTSSGEMQIDLGHLAQADLTLTMGYDTAKAQIVSGDQAAVMQAFMGGRIKIDGDMSKLMALAAGAQAGGPDAQAVAQKVAEEIQSITE